MRRALLFVSLSALAACGGLRSNRGDGGELPADGCMRTLADAVQVPAPEAPNGFAGVRSLVFAPDGTLFVLNRPGNVGPSYVTELGPRPAHAFRRAFGREHLGRTFDLAITSDRTVLIVEEGPALSDKPVLFTFAPGGDAPATQRTLTEVSHSFSVLSEPGGNVLVGASEVIQRYGPDGGPAGYFGGPLTKLAWPNDLAFDAQGTLWVADMAANEVRQYDTSSRGELTSFGGRGSGKTQFDGAETDPGVVWGPGSLALDAQGNIYATDPTASRIVKLSRQGGFLGEFSFGGSRAIESVAVDPISGNVYVSRGNAIDIVCPL